MILEDYALTQKRSSDRVERALLHLRPTFEGVRLGQVSDLARAYVRERIAEGASLSTVRIELAALGRELTLRLRNRKIPYRPYLPHIRVENARDAYFEDVEAVCKHLPEVIADLARLAAITGFRKREATGLRWSQVDERFGVLRLPGRSTKNGRTKIFPFKVNKRLAAVIARRRAVQDGDFVFHRGGKEIRDFRVVWRRALTLSGNQGKVWHDWKRTAGRGMLFSGMPIRGIQELLGVKTLEVLLEHYLPVSQKDLEPFVGRL